MTTGHLITNTDLTLLGNINLSHLDDTCRQLVADSNSKFLTFQLCIEFLIFLDKVRYQCTDQFIGMLVFCPIAQLNSSKVYITEIRSIEFSTFTDYFSSHIVFHTF